MPLPTGPVLEIWAIPAISRLWIMPKISMETHCIKPFKDNINTSLLMFTCHDSSKYMFLLFMKNQKHTAIEANYHILRTKKQHMDTCDLLLMTWRSYGFSKTWLIELKSMNHWLIHGHVWVIYYWWRLKITLKKSLVVIKSMNHWLIHKKSIVEKVQIANSQFKETHFCYISRWTTALVHM